MNRQDERERYEALYRETYPKVVAYCRRRLPTVDADDAVAEIFTVAWQKAHEFTTADQPLAWLYGVGFRVISNRYRAARRARDLNLVMQHEPMPSQVSPDSEVELSDEVGRAFDALARLSTEDQEIIRLAALEEMTAPQIGAILGVDAGAARSRLYRARGRLREAFEEPGAS